MKLFALLLCALSLLSATAAEARHHRGYHAHHVAVPMPKPRPVTAPAWAIPRRSIAEQLVAIGMWRLQTDPFYRR